MKILRQAKANKPIDLNVASFIFTILEVEIMMLFCANPSMIILQKIFGLTKNNSALQSLVIIIFILNLAEILYFIFKILVTQKSKNTSYEKSTLLASFQIKPYLFMAQILSLNIEKVQTAESKFIVLAAIFNIVFPILEVFALQVISISYRFVEKNYIRRKNNSILPWILILPIIFALQFYGSIYGSAFLLIRALTQLYFNFNNLENGQIRFCQWFFPLVSIQLTFLIFVHVYLNLSIFSNAIILMFIIIFTAYCCNDLSTHFSIRVPKYHLETCQHIMESENQDNSSINGGSIQINESEMEKTLLQLRIMVKIHLSRLKHDAFEENEGSETEKYDHWWTFYNQFILDHRVYCQNVTCQCNKIQFKKQIENHEIEKRIFADKIYAVIKKLQAESSVSVNKLKIIENYFLIEMQKKPMKTYYQLMKIEREKLNREETLEIENLVFETRENFKQLFFRQKVQNTELDIEPLFQFQDHIKAMRSELNDMAVEYRYFYEIFVNNFVQMQILKQKTRSLTQFKKRFSHEIDFCLKKFDKSLELMTFCIVYFKFFDEYTNKFEKVEEKAQFLMEVFKNPLNISKRGSVDIFDPHYGAIKADLAFKIGYIITITKNLCHTLGFTHQQLQDQKVNKLMPTMFARNHDKFLRNFVEKGSLKMLKFKERVFYAKHMNKFLLPLTMRLKVDYSNSDGFYAVSFIKPAPTKSEFILMNNYGKIQEITEGLYKRLFDKALGDDILKVKRLCASKLILSLNYLLKETSQNRDLIYEGLMTTSDIYQDLISYFKFPQFGKTYRHKSLQHTTESSRTGRSIQQTDSSTDGSRTLDFSQDLATYTIDLKESLRNYFGAVDIKKIRGYRVSYRFYTSVTNEFKFKILEVINVKDLCTNAQLGQSFRNQILGVGEYLGFEEQQLLQFKILNQNSELGTQDSDLSYNQMSIFERKQNQSEINEIKKTQKKIINNNLRKGEPESETSSILSASGKSRSKEGIINAFEQQTVISQNLERGLIILIIMMAAILVTVSVFSISMRGNYESIQNDNSIITNFRIQFLLRLAIQQLSQLYGSYGLAAPSFIEERKNILNENMRELLMKATKWISMSGDFYQDKILFSYSEIDYSHNRTILDSFQYIFYIFEMADSQEEYIIQNYGTINSHLLNLTNFQESMILDMSDFYKMQIHFTVAVYTLLLLTLVVVLILIKRVAIIKEDKIIDFLPFFKSSHAKKISRFFDLFIEYNKTAENLDANHAERLFNEIDQQNSLSLTISLNKKFDKNTLTIKQSNNDRLIRIVKNESNGITVKGLMYAIGTVILCLFVMAFAEYFFLQTDTKFMAYMEMKYTSFLVQLIPSRIILLYLPNIDRVFKHNPMLQLPDSFYTLAHDEIFSFMTDQANPDYYGTQMEEIILRHFTTNLCDMISCTNASQVAKYQNQQLFYLAYRYVNAFNYLRIMISNLPKENDPEAIIKQWIDENQVFSLLESLDFILDLMNKNQEEISDLFAQQINQTGTILLSLSLTLIPILIFVMLYARKLFVDFVKERVSCTENIYKHFSWNVLTQNTYAINYFSDKLKNSKTK